MALDPVPTYPGNYDANEANNTPSGSDTRREGDDQLRRIKASEKSTWTNVTGAVTASHEEINRLVGVSLTNPIITLPSGTKATVYQDTAPPEWTIDAVPDEMIMRVTKGLAAAGVEGGTSGGTNNFSDQFAAHAEDATYGVRNHTLTVSEMPAHAHGGATGSHTHGMAYITGGGSVTFGSGTGWAGNVSGTSPGYYAVNTSTNVNPNMLVAATSSISSDGGGAAHAHTIDLAAKWAAFIIITKD